MSKRNGIQLAYPFEERRLLKWNTWPVLVQPKLDGMRCRAIPDSQKGWTLLSSEEHEIISVPHVGQELDRIIRNPIELDGELYIHGFNFESIESVARRTTNVVQNTLEYHIFDYVSSEPQGQRLINLRELDQLTNRISIKVVPTRIAHNLGEILQTLEIYKSAGYEGIIVRHPNYPYERKRSTGMMKLKPLRQDAYEIVGYNEEISIHGEPKGSLGSFICRGDDQTEFAVGSGFTADQRAAYWLIRDQLIGQFLVVNYQNLTAKRGVPRFPIFEAFVRPNEKL